MVIYNINQISLVVFVSINLYCISIERQILNVHFIILDLEAHSSSVWPPCTDEE